MPELLRHPRPYRLFVPLLRHSDNAEEPIPLLASSVLASLLAAAVVRSASSAAFPLSADAEHALEQLFAYLSALAGSADSGFQDIAVQEYSALLRSRRAREIFWRLRHKTLSPLMDVLLAAVGAGAGHGGRNGGGGSSSGGGGDDTSTLWSGVGGPSSLGTTLRNGSESGSIGGGGGGGASTLGGGVGLQLLYHILLVLWQLSFDAEMVGEGLQEYVSPNELKKKNTYPGYIEQFLLLSSQPKPAEWARKYNVMWVSV
jgi:V-type H+-transporting ATPase subunit H